MPTPSGKIKAGATSFAAAEFNRHVDASDAYHRTKALGNPLVTRQANTDTNIVKVRNNSGADRRAGDILEFTGLELTSLTDDIPMLWLTGGSPTLANGFGVLLRASSSGSTELEDCQVAGVCRAYVNVIDADDRYARPSASTYVLQSSAIGPVKIIYKPSGTGEKMCAVQLMGVTGEILVYNNTGSAIAAGSSGTFEVHSGTPGSATSTGQTITAYNRSSVSWANGKYGACSILEGHAYAAPWQT